MKPVTKKNPKNPPKAKGKVEGKPIAPKEDPTLKTRAGKQAAAGKDAVATSTKTSGKAVTAAPKSNVSTKNVAESAKKKLLPAKREAPTKPEGPVAKKPALTITKKDKPAAAPLASSTSAGAAVTAAPTASSAKPKRKHVKRPLRGKSGAAKKKIRQRFVIDCASVAEDLILDVADLEKYMKSHIKVNQRINNLGEHVIVERSKQFTLVVNSSVHFAKRYFKYLAKRYLKKHSLRDWVRVVSTSKDTFTMRYFKIQSQDDDDDGDAFDVKM